jgi:hypothetical protein
LQSWPPEQKHTLFTVSGRQVPLLQELMQFGKVLCAQGVDSQLHLPSLAVQVVPDGQMPEQYGGLAPLQVSQVHILGLPGLIMHLPDWHEPTQAGVLAYSQ